MTFPYNLYKITSALALCGFLMACSQSYTNLTVIDKVQRNYENTVSLENRYIHGNYGAPDPASFNRLKQYRSDAYQALMQFRAQFDKNKPLPTESLENAKNKINIYQSYLNALGATSATKDTFTGF